MAVVRELVATFELDVDEQSFDKAERSIDGVIKGAQILGGIFLGGAIAAGFSKVINLASDATEDLNLLNIVFGQELTPTILEWASQTAKAVNRSEFELRRFVATSQAMLAPMLGGADAAAQFSTELVQATIDLASLRNLTDPVAFQKLTAALAGESEPLRRLGIDTREAAFDQFLLSKGIARTNKDLPLQRRNLERVKFVLDAVSAAQGDAIRTANDFANVQKGIEAASTDLATRIGKVLLPAQTRFGISTRNTAFAMLDWVKANEEWLSQTIGDAFGDFLQVLDNVAKGVVQAVRFFGDLVNRMPPLSKGILVAVAAVTALIAILAIPGAPFIALLALIGLIIDDLVVFGEGGTSVIGAIIKAIQDFLPSAEGALESLGLFFSQTWDAIKATAVAAWDFITELFTGGSDAADARSDDIFDSFSDTWELLKTTAGSLMESMKDIFLKGFQVIADFLDETFDIDTEKSIQDLQVFITRARNVIAGLLRNPVVKLLLRLVAAKLGAAAGEFVGEGVSELVTGIIPKNKVTRALGLDQLVEGVTKTIVGSVSKVAGGVLGFATAGDFSEGLADVLETEPGFSSVAQMTAGGVGAAVPLLQSGGGPVSMVDNSNVTANITLTTQPGQSNLEIAEFIPGVLEAFREETQAQQRTAMESFAPATP